MTANSENRAILVTGAAGGLGTVMTTALLEAGHAVAALDRDQAALDKLAATRRAAPRPLSSPFKPNLPIRRNVPMRWRKRARISDAWRASSTMPASA